MSKSTAVTVYNSLESIINPATEEKQDNIVSNLKTNKLVKGGKFSEVLTLTDANTAYPVPSTQQDENCTMVLYNPSDTSIYIKGLSGTTGGDEIPPQGKWNIDIAANVQLYVYCSEAGKTLNVEMFKLET